MNNPRWRASRLAVIGITVSALALTGCAGAGDNEPAATAPEEGSDQAAEEPSLEFAGPNGEVPATLDQLALTDDERAQVSAGAYTAAFVWHTSSEFVSAVEQGAREEFESLGIEVVASTEAGFDAATQASNIESVLALQPDIVVGIAVDAVSAEASFQPIVDAGVKLVIMTTPPANFTAGEEFVSIVTESLTDAGRANAELLGEALGGQGTVGYIFFDADFWFTQQRDQAFLDWMAFLYPDIEIVAQEGFADEARTEEVAGALIARNPDVQGLYVSWATAAQGVVAALRNAGSDAKIVTNDLDATLAADLVAGGNVVGLVGNGALDIGRGLAIAGAFGVLGKEAPALVASPPVEVTADNLAEAWLLDYGTEPPAGVR